MILYYKMTKTILANHLSCSYRDYPTKLFNRIIIKIADFDKNLWYMIGLSIMQELFIYSGSVEWDVTDDGVVIGNFTNPFSAYTEHHIKMNDIYIDTQLIWKNEKRFLIITKKANELHEQYTRVLHVTDDGIWLASDRDLELQDSIEDSIKEKQIDWKNYDVSKMMYHLEYDTELYNYLWNYKSPLKIR